MTIIIYTNLNTLMEKQLIIIALTDIYMVSNVLQEGFIQMVN